MQRLQVVAFWGLMLVMVPVVVGLGVMIPFAMKAGQDQVEQSVGESGRAAARAGVPPLANPHEGGFYRSLWLRGWIEEAGTIDSEEAALDL